MAKKPNQSKHFKDFNKNLDTIEKTFLSMDIKPDGAYNLHELTMARAYGILVHAEIESYFENIAKEIVLKSYNKWILDKKSSHVLMSIAAFSHPKKEIPGNMSNQKVNDEGLIEKRLDTCVKKYMGIIDRNHGIKEENLLKILLPLGIHLNDIDNTFLISADSFGHYRGNLAHNSIKTKSLTDPFAKKKEVNYLLTEIRKLDTKINSLK